MNRETEARMNEKNDRDELLEIIVAYVPSREGIPKVQDVWLADAILASEWFKRVSGRGLRENNDE